MPSGLTGQRTPRALLEWGTVVFGLLISAQAATSLLGMALAGVLGDRLGIVPTLCLHAGGAITAGLLVVLKPERHAR